MLTVETVGKFLKELQSFYTGGEETSRQALNIDIGTNTLQRAIYLSLLATNVYRNQSALSTYYPAHGCSAEIPSLMISPFLILVRVWDDEGPHHWWCVEPPPPEGECFPPVSTLHFPVGGGRNFFGGNGQK